ncbi:Uncharacterised protein [Yokenella regensburgei]|nr:Uncharacterised protein [Yokenella regensburgei]
MKKDGKIFLNGTKIDLEGVESVNGDALMINWNCGCNRNRAGCAEIPVDNNASKSNKRVLRSIT